MDARRAKRRRWALLAFPRMPQSGGVQCVPSPLSSVPLFVAGRAYAYDIDCWNTSQAFQKGHRIRLEIASSAFPKCDRNPNTGAAQAGRRSGRRTSRRSTTTGIIRLTSSCRWSHQDRDRAFGRGEGQFRARGFCHTGLAGATRSREFSQIPRSSWFSTLAETSTA
jgi:hypothetical protein